jgi:hypothetical protein
MRGTWFDPRNMNPASPAARMAERERIRQRAEIDRLLRETEAAQRPARRSLLSRLWSRLPGASR